ncbi:Peptidoglycan/LPS O-acetylase OafA/YrhL [Commensalibacter communis]|uniref:acyltransferase family protein n=1 Tax=Commensalibacter communis TaxID=2972786 RepID=UPI0022FF8F50|nr:acyltransferase [Commensalibacter communis]CAI3929262.1 Peptidoglycan/LPS O-acetylase OafA/YrhL [Commensalibacter communis]
MTYFSIWPFFIIMALLLLVLSLPIFRVIKPNTQNTHRVQTIDGLRGFLAYGVVFSHGQNFHTLLATGQWAGSPNPFYNMFGTVAVRLFFMVTAYLFWSRLLASHGKMNWQSFYIKRLFRIAPVYWCACLGVFTIVMIETHWTLRVPWTEFAKQIGSWLALGILPLPDINNHMMSFMILLGVVWTLQYEWLFYGLLPLVAWFAQNKVRALIFIICAIIFILISAYFLQSYPIIRQVWGVLFMFLMGMLCATLQQYAFIIPFNSMIQSFFVSAMIMAIFILAPNGIYVSSILFAVIFFFIISGCSLFGLLTSSASQRMGEVSYGIYLLQGIAFYWVYSVPFVRHYVLQGSMEFWGIMTLICTLILFFAIIVHIILEKPGVKIGYRLSVLLSARK